MTNHSSITLSDPLSRAEVLARLRAASTHRNLSAQEHAALEAIADRLDGQPAAVDLIANEIGASSAKQVQIKLDHDLLAERLEPAAWGFSWDEIDHDLRLIFCAFACVDVCIDARALADITGLDDPEKTCAALTTSRILTEHTTTPRSWSMSWTPRMLVLQQMDDIKSWGARRAWHFIERMKARDTAPLDIVEPNLERAFVHGMVHDSDIATRAALKLYLIGLMREAPMEPHLKRLESVVARRQFQPGNPLDLELLTCMGSAYRRFRLYEQSVEVLELALALDPPVDEPIFGSIHIDLAISSSYSGEPQRALHFATIARDTFSTRADDAQLPYAMSVLATIHARQNNYELARTLLEDATRLEPDASTWWINLGAVHLELGEGADARRCFEHALTLPALKAPLNLELIVLNNIVVLDLLEDDEERARARIERIHWIHNAIGGYKHHLDIYLCNQALYGMRHASLLEAYHLISEAVEIAPEDASLVALECAITSYLGDIAEAKRSFDALSCEEMNEKFQVAEYRAFAANALALGSITSGAATGSVEDLAREIFDKDTSHLPCLLQAFYQDMRARLSALTSPKQVIRIHPEGKHVSIDALGVSVDLSQSSVTRCLLLKLIEHHQTGHSGEPCAVEDLFEAAWPDQVWNLSARTRLHTAIHRLRHRVLGDLLITHQDLGYSLARQCEIERLDDQM